MFQDKSINKPALNLNRVLADLNRGSNSLNSISDDLTNGDLYTYVPHIIQDMNTKVGGLRFVYILWLLYISVQ